MGIIVQIREALEADARPKKDIAKAVGIDPISLSLFMNGHRNVSSAVLDRIGEVLGVQIVAKPKRKRGGK